MEYLDGLIWTSSPVHATELMGPTKVKAICRHLVCAHVPSKTGVTTKLLHTTWCHWSVRKGNADKTFKTLYDIISQKVLRWAWSAVVYAAHDGIVISTGLYVVTQRWIQECHPHVIYRITVLTHTHTSKISLFFPPFGVLEIFYATFA